MKQPSSKPRRSFNDVYQGEIVSMLHREGAWTRASVTGMFTQIEPGAADLMVTVGGKGCAIEVKTGFNGNFAFANWRDNQREWAKEYTFGTACLYWLAIVIETPKPKWKGHRKGRVAFLIPNNLLYVAEAAYAADRVSIPYQDALSMWGEFELHWSKGWFVPKSHPFYQIYLGENK